MRCSVKPLSGGPESDRGSALSFFVRKAGLLMLTNPIRLCKALRCVAATITFAAVFTGCSSRSSDASRYDDTSTDQIASRYQQPYRSTYGSGSGLGAAAPSPTTQLKTGLTPTERFLADRGVTPAPTKAQIAVAELGPMPTAGQVRKAVEITLRRELKDFDSAKIELHDPVAKAVLSDDAKADADSRVMPVRAYYVKDVRAKTTEEAYGIAWSVSVFVNAKNSYGGYTGFKRWYFFWKDGVCVHHSAP